MSSRKSRSATTSDPERQLMIKTKACQRLAKEKSYYESEVRENEAKLSQMKSNQEDPFDIKKFEEVLGESYMMIPDSKSRLDRSLEDLRLFLEKHANELNSEGEWMPVAKELTHQESAGEDKTGGDVVLTETNLKDGEAF